MVVDWLELPEERLLLRVVLDGQLVAVVVVGLFLVDAGSEGPPGHLEVEEDLRVGPVAEELLELAAVDGQVVEEEGYCWQQERVPVLEAVVEDDTAVVPGIVVVH